MRLVLGLLAAALLTGCGQARFSESPAPDESTDGFFCVELDPGQSPDPDADPRCPPGTG